MLEAAPRRDVQASWIGSTAQERQRRKLLVAIVLLLSAVILMLGKDRDFWLSSEETPATEAESSPNLPAQTTAIAANPAIPVVATKQSTQPTAKHAALRPLEPNAVAGNAHNAAQVRAHQGSNAAEAVQTASIKAPVVESAYPLLAGQMSVQGSVLMQALIAPDGIVEDLRVLSGPTILVTAAREAVRQWKFKPYLQNGKPVETQARVTVNFTIKVSNNTARYQATSITSDGAL